MIYQGKVTAVDTTASGATLAADALLGASSIVLDDPTEFLTGVSQLQIGTNAQIYQISSVDGESGVLGLSPALVADAAEGLDVYVYPYSEEKVAQVQLNDSDDAILALIPHALYDQFEVGVRDLELQESVTVVEERQHWAIQDVVAEVPIMGERLSLNEALAAQAADDAAAAASAAAAANGTATTALNGLTGKIVHTDYAPTTEANNVNDTWFVHDTSGAIVSQYTGLGGTSWTPSTISHQVISSVDLGTATVGKLAANYLDTGVLSAAITLTGYIIAGNPTGARVVIDDGGIRQYDASGNIVINLPTDPDTPSVFEGAVIANSITIEDYMSLQGLFNQIARGAVLTVSGGTGAPLNAPSIAVAYPVFNQTRWSYLYVPSGHHCDIDDSNDMLGAMTFFGYGKIFGRADKYWTGPEYTDSEGTKRTKYGNIGSATAIYVPGVGERLVVMSIYTPSSGLAPTSKVSVIDPAPMNSSGTVEPTLKVQLNAKNDDYLFQIKLGRVLGPNGGTNYCDRIAMGLNNWNGSVYGSGMITLRQYTITDTTITLVSGSEKIISSPLATDEQLIGVTHGYTDKLGFPLGASAPYNAGQYVWLVHGSVKTYAYNSGGTARLPDYDFPTPPSGMRMNAWGNVQNNDFIGFRTTEWSATTPITKMTNNHWIAGTSDRWWVSTTNYDSDITGGTHESTQGPRASITMKKRAGIAITVPPYPVRPSPTTTDDPLSARVYLGRGATTSDPGRAAMERAGELNSPNRTLAVGNFTFPALPGNVAAAPPPSSSNFPASAPGKIVSADGTSWSLAGDGKFTAAGVEFDGTIPGLKSSAMRAVEYRYTDSSAFGISLTTYTDCGARGGRGTFVAPPSGSVWIEWSVLSKSGTANQFVSADVEVRTGSTIGSGTVIRACSANDSALNFGLEYVTVTHFVILTALTPGATYNARMMYAANPAGNACTLNRGRMIIAPLP